MHKTLAVLVLYAALAGTALAQSTAPASQGAATATGSSNNAVNPPGNASSDVNASGTANVVAPVALEKGSNSFTEGQARKRLEGAGFTTITGLHKDDAGIWRGQASRGGKSVAVGFDYKGNIGAE